MVAQHHTKTPYVGFPFNFSSCTIDANKTINTPSKKIPSCLTGLMDNQAWLRKVWEVKMTFC